MATNDKLKAAFSRISRNLNIKVSAGVLAGATNEDTGEKIAPYAAANEFGTRNIPARPFMRSTIANKSDEWKRLIGDQLRGQSQDESSVEAAFNTLGMIMAADIQESIRKNIPPKNSQSTQDAKERKGIKDYDKTLIDTGGMEGAIDYEVIKGGE
ncbi:hypothetical protein [Xenorhabdus hominickii]|uniref:Bacteriophage protein n=1 Tax=Xenorhabdus hominickii TaxID=351679 RepID=A0A2G0Q2I9_XENHO|nr:hypothetical protein [Xenorhabdus hominickii]AOM39673.1 hypothetical protein A9255_03155 [Xenorhabdus hominickii]PHM53432.1 bacteriophage protein [Xenorhabdus hominickii]